MAGFLHFGHCVLWIYRTPGDFPGPWIPLDPKMWWGRIFLSPCSKIHRDWIKKNATGYFFEQFANLILEKSFFNHMIMLIYLTRLPKPSFEDSRGHWRPFMSLMAIWGHVGLFDTFWDGLKPFEAILRPFWGQFEANWVYWDYLRLFEVIRGHLKLLGPFFVVFHDFFTPKIFAFFFWQNQENQNIHPRTFWAVDRKLLNSQQRDTPL